MVVLNFLTVEQFGIQIRSYVRDLELGTRFCPHCDVPLKGCFDSGGWPMAALHCGNGHWISIQDVVRAD